MSETDNFTDDTSTKSISYKGNRRGIQKKGQKQKKNRTIGDEIVELTELELQMSFWSLFNRRAPKSRSVIIIMSQVREDNVLHWKL